MNPKVLETGTRMARRHPRKTLQLSVFAIRRRKAILMVVNSARRATELGSTVKQAAGDRKVQSETSAAMSSLMLAGKRARQVGVAHAPGDKKVAVQLHRAGRHASKALVAARRPRHGHRTPPPRGSLTGASTTFVSAATEASGLPPRAVRMRARKPNGPPPACPSQRPRPPR